ncbi:hypothetical protein [Streptomyces sp. SPB162]|uniref:hypothetical protein n=1 Tax=Streptomyces sp. SPB162 TaxID=2940560 RepID=UPI003216E957
MVWQARFGAQAPPHLVAAFTVARRYEAGAPHPQRAQSVDARPGRRHPPDDRRRQPRAPRGRSRPGTAAASWPSPPPPGST